jgi:hypothetical protein
MRRTRSAGQPSHFGNDFASPAKVGHGRLGAGLSDARLVGKRLALTR